ncbi:DUF945 domain-containing protein [Salmonella enterica]|uniref:DUF932 domain-containing protein n=1 Tax=Salmonella enterica TaxID=28901 RepID=UPI000D585482|nr:DUF932 domain-containing protein [Salmonella enterica]EAW2151908.1 DUF945 domain-containing protein [Salmonella enterica subsp. enterica]EBM0715655.1 DUF945 domain-containing protein [Salmonella enterica subsp. enterica serovar Agona]EBW8697270.1 DUF945 domain-containing protein [Salmonella enterica subsp. diarizonae serovar 16:z10:e,n,x,z15]EFO5651671.1 DUF945 domain-containing protein [Salmonella enterica subsp. enterica serovar Miami]HBP7551730.1 DUF945 domain-containing protein [Salmone
MSSFANRYHAPSSIRQKRALTNEELQRIVPSAFSAEKHDSRSERYTYIPTIEILDRLREEGFQPFYAKQSRTRDIEKREFTKHLLRLRRHDQIQGGNEIPEIILLNSHDGSSSYKMIPGMFRQVCSNGLVAWKDFGEISVPHKGDIVGQVIDGAFEVLRTFERVEQNIDLMRGIEMSHSEQLLLGSAALDYRYEGKQAPITPEQVINPRRWEDNRADLWTTFNRIQENVIKGGISGRTEKGKRTRTREVTGIDGDIKLNQALWKMAEEFAKLKA